MKEDIEKKLEALREKWKAGTRKERGIIELQARALKKALAMTGKDKLVEQAQKLFKQ